MTIPELFVRNVYRSGAAVWEEYGALVRQMALGLVAAGVAPGDRVGVAIEDSRRWRAADLAVLCAGAVSVVDNGGDRRFLDDASLRAAGAELDDFEPDLFERRSRSVRAADAATVVDDVTITHANLVWTVQSVQRLLQLRGGEAVVSTAALDVMGGRVLGHYLPAALGLSLTDTAGVDAMRIAGRDPVTVNGEPVYGPTAACGVVSVGGRLIPGVTVAIGDDGEILVQGGNVAPERAHEGWLCTGDAGDLDAEGGLHRG